MFPAAVANDLKSISCLHCVDSLNFSREKQIIQERMAKLEVKNKKQIL